MSVEKKSGCARDRRRDGAPHRRGAVNQLLVAAHFTLMTATAERVGGKKLKRARVFFPFDEKKLLREENFGRGDALRKHNSAVNGLTR